MAWHRRDPAEEQLFLGAVSNKFKQGCLVNKQADDCDLLARFTEMIAQDFNKAAAIYRSNCDDYQCGQSCLRYAQCSVFGRGLPKDPARAFEYTQKGCALGEAESCRMAGMACIPNIAVYNSVYVKTDYLAGLNFLKRGCDLRDSDSCYMVGGLYLSGVAPVIEADPAAAFHYDFKACMLGSNVACVNLGGVFAEHSERSKITGPGGPVRNGLEWRMEQLKTHLLFNSSGIAK